MFNPSPFKISTITATGSVGTTINLDILYEHLTLIDYDNSSISEGFIYIEFGKKKSDSYYRGFHKKLTITRRKKVEAKRFDNQATVVLRLTTDNVQHYVNCKVFRNGNIQMTGLKNTEQGKYVVQCIIDELKLIASSKDTNVVGNVADMVVTKYQIRLINSDFRVGFNIKRDKLNKIIQEEGAVYSSYEPCIYPGVKVQYNYNEASRTRDGICHCASMCNGKGCGNGDGQCKKITIAVFQSGCVIITGAQAIAQIEEAYDYIVDILKEHLEVILKTVFVTPENTIETKKKILVKKSSIVASTSNNRC
jgi:TATA-box binding protein (TBP) (component of TFIID and TFIIIB)